MPRPAIRMTSDYIRGPLLPIALAAALFIVLLPFDGPISRAARALSLRGDLQREINAWQQYGGVGSLLFTAVVIWLADPKSRRRLLDLAAASAVVGIGVMAVKLLVGRPRPRPDLDDPVTFLGPFGEYPITLKDGSTVLAHAWDPIAWRSADLWSMPSSHTAYAASLSVFLVALYPRLWPLGAFMVALVAACRVLTDAHWPTDVVIGAALAYVLARAAVQGRWGDRAVEWVWSRFRAREARVLSVQAATVRERPTPVQGADTPPAPG